MSPFELTWLQRQIKLHVNPHQVSALPSSPALPCPVQSRLGLGYLLVDRRLAGLAHFCLFYTSFALIAIAHGKKYHRV